MKSDNPKPTLRSADDVFRRLAAVEQVSIAPKLDGETPVVKLPAVVAPLQWLDMSAWDGAPIPEREWAIRDRVPLKQAGLFW